jgi:hypothetical protein
MSKPLKTPAPLSVRLTQAERDALLIRAGGQTLSAYVRAVLFDGPQPMPRSGGVTLANRTLLAHLLATLGASQLAPNLAQLASEASAGNLFADEETTQRLIEACDDLRLMHNALMRGLGMREKTASHREIEASAAFGKVAKPWGEQ